MGFATMRRLCALLALSVLAAGLSTTTLAAPRARAARSPRRTRGTVCPRADLAGRNLAGKDLRNADLAGADLTGATLTGAILLGADLSRGEP